MFTEFLLAPGRAVSHWGQGTAPLDSVIPRCGSLSLAAALPREAAIDAESGPLEEIARLFPAVAGSISDLLSGPVRQVF